MNLEKESLNVKGYQLSMMEKKHQKKPCQPLWKIEGNQPPAQQYHYGVLDLKNEIMNHGHQGMEKCLNLHIFTKA